MAAAERLGDGALSREHRLANDTDLRSASDTPMDKARVLLREKIPWGLRTYSQTVPISVQAATINVNNWCRNTHMVMPLMIVGPEVSRVAIPVHEAQ